ncbi:HAD phosphatase, family IIIA [Cyphellophora europaea CBS 101466]|uniref:HAD phosphatase, family IIIA n=1 Tax=Cyphellophora europaea (strain CBS 101466) TaxID=1220924 RepID=W2SAN7_CYPE1|nr:HAD phosphatase, family IIIA [Cyphellophora europaea CBS 101466]ETN44959.1 HAD phosphatase, family IIIA [Cyphellophora europaea CBS 101466]
MPLLSNLPALRLTLAYALHEPSSLLPHRTIATLLALPLPVGIVLPSLPGSEKKPTIKALVLDKDNTICPPETAVIHPAYRQKIEQIKSSPEFAGRPHSILIVSNTAGSTRSAEHEAEAKHLEAELGLPVLRQQPGRKKPLCGPDVLLYFREHGITENPAEIAFVGDRLATDVLVAREVGSWSIWCRDGWRDPVKPATDYRGLFAKAEGILERILRERLSRSAPLPVTPRHR